MNKNNTEISLHKNSSHWEKIAQDFTWQKKWDSVQSGSFEQGNVKFYEGAKLNVAQNCIDRHLLTQPHKRAIIFEPNDPTLPTQTLTYQELHDRVCQMSHLLVAQGVQPNDVVCFYLPLVPELLMGMLACARIGAIHSVVFGGFSAQALSERLVDAQAKLLITCQKAQRGEKIINYAEIAREAMQKSACVKKCLYLEEINQLMQNFATTFEPVQRESEDPLFILYTSGSTGKPKGLLHTSAGYMVWAGYTFSQVFNCGSEDIFWCTADLGWITGHSYVAYGPLLNGATILMYEGIPTYPQPNRFWQIIEKHLVTHFYTAPTAIRALESMGNEWVQNFAMPSLKVLGSVGEPINSEAWHWFHHYVGHDRCPLVDTWWQTETGGIMISARAGRTPCIPTKATIALEGIELSLVNENGVEIGSSDVSSNVPSEHCEIVQEGILVLKKPWPGMARSIFNDHARYLENYFKPFPGYYFTGDAAERDHLGNYRILGRVDDVVNVSGHRIGTAELENCINQHDLIVESAVVGAPHPIKGECLVAFAILMFPGKTEAAVLQEINFVIQKNIGSFAKCERIIFTEQLPKTRSGKIMRRILRKILAGIQDKTQLGDLSTLLNPEIVDSLMKKVMLSLMFFILAKFSMNAVCMSKAFASIPEKPLTLQHYLQQIIEKNDTLKATSLAINAQMDKAQEASLITAPYLFGTAALATDQRETLNPNFMGRETKGRQYQLGIQEKTAWGQDLTLSYLARYSDLRGVQLPNAASYEVGPQIEISQSLWQNFLGSQVRMQQKMIELSSLQNSAMQKFQAKKILQGAEDLYWSLALAKESLSLQLESLNRVAQIKKWAQDRTQKELADESDLLQAQAQLLSKKYDVEKTTQDVQSLQLRFNALREVKGAELPEQLVIMSDQEMESLQIPATINSYENSNSVREDLQASQYQTQMSQIQAKLKHEETLPKLELFGSMSYWGREPEYSDARREAFDRDHEYWTLGLRFSAPLEFGTVARVNDAYVQEANAKNFQTNQEQIELEREWHDLKDQFIQNKNNFLLAQKIKQAQTKKLEYEKKRLAKGRTTTYQVLLFELDLLHAELLVLESKSALLKNYTQLKLFNPYTI